MKRRVIGVIGLLALCCVVTLFAEVVYASDTKANAVESSGDEGVFVAEGPFGAEADSKTYIWVSWDYEVPTYLPGSPPQQTVSSVTVYADVEEVFRHGGPDAPPWYSRSHIVSVGYGTGAASGSGSASLYYNANQSLGFPNGTGYYSSYYVTLYICAIYPGNVQRWHKCSSGSVEFGTQP